MQFVPSGTFLQPQQSSPTYELFPHRVFVGGFPVATTESELREHFEQHGQVREVKIIRAVDGLSKGYGFVSTETEEEAEAMRNWSPEKLEFKGKKLNIGPALRRMSANRYPSEYTVATPTGLVPAASLGYSYAVNHPFVMMPPVMFNTPPNTAKIPVGANSLSSAPHGVAPGQPYFFNTAHQMPQMVDMTQRSQQIYADSHINSSQSNSGQRSPVAEASQSSEHGFIGANNVHDPHVPTMYPYAFYVQQPTPVPFVANASNVYPAGVPYFGTPDASGAPANVFGIGYPHNMVSPLPMNYAYTTNMASGDGTGMTATSLTNGNSMHDEEVFTPGKYSRTMEHGDPHRSFSTPNSVGPHKVQQSAGSLRTPVNQIQLADPPRYSRAARKINLHETSWSNTSDDKRSIDSKGSAVVSMENRLHFAGRNDGSPHYTDGQHYKQSTYKTNRNNGRYMQGPNPDRPKNAPTWKSKPGTNGDRVSSLTSHLSSMSVNDHSNTQDKTYSGEKHLTGDYAGTSSVQKTSVA